MLEMCVGGQLRAWLLFLIGTTIQTLFILMGEPFGKYWSMPHIFFHPHCKILQFSHRKIFEGNQIIFLEMALWWPLKCLRKRCFRLCATWWGVQPLIRQTWAEGWGGLCSTYVICPVSLTNGNTISSDTSFFWGPQTKFWCPHFQKKIAKLWFLYLYGVILLTSREYD